MLVAPKDPEPIWAMLWSPRKVESNEDRHRVIVRDAAR